MSLLVSTVWVIPAIAISSYSSSHHSLSSLIYLHQSPLYPALNQGSLSKKSQCCFILPNKLSCPVSFILETLSPLFLPSWHFSYLSGLPFTPGESQQGSNDFLGFELLTADQYPLFSSVNLLSRFPNFQIDIAVTFAV